MQSTQDNTPARWESVIADLTAKANRYEIEITELAKARDSLALDAELGQDGAARQLRKISGEIATKQSAVSTIGTAIQQAKAKLQDARKAEAAEAERQRQVQDAAQDLMNDQERVPIQQLRTDFGATLAAAHYGLGNFIELGRAASNVGGADIAA